MAQIETDWTDCEKYHRVCNKSNMTGDSSGVGTVSPSGAPVFTLSF